MDVTQASANTPANAQSTAKRWCFTLNNYVATDYFNADHLIDPDLYDYLVFGKERASSGTPHLQGFVCWKSPKRLSSLKKILYRANWSVSKDKTLLKAANYCKKGEQSHEEWQQFGTEGPNFGLNAIVFENGTLPTSGGGKAPKEYWWTAASTDTNYDQAIQAILDADPRAYILHGRDIRANLEYLKAPKIEYKPRYTLEQFCHPPLTFPLNKVTLVYGPTGTGKTSFVKAHFKNPLFIRHVDLLRNYRPFTFDAIIFDDYSCAHCPFTFVLSLTDTMDVSHVHIRYSVAILQPSDVDNCPRIFIHNLRNPFYSEETPDEQKAAIERRINRFHVMNNLYK